MHTPRISIVYSYTFFDNHDNLDVVVIQLLLAKPIPFSLYLYCANTTGYRVVMQGDTKPSH